MGFIYKCYVVLQNWAMAIFISLHEWVFDWRKRVLNLIGRSLKIYKFLALNKQLYIELGKLLV